MKRYFLLISILFIAFAVQSWGFFAHKTINRMAVFTLPPEMIGFYKRNIHVITEQAVNPDMRRYIIKEEAARHYIDLDVYGDSAFFQLPHSWGAAVEKYSEDTLNAYGIVPWHLQLMKYKLTQAFLKRDAAQIIRLSADLGHYVADANVPLHTTQNYNGQLTGQYGIHGFWESRLPELFSKTYDLFTGKARYLENTQEVAWNAVKGANDALDSVFILERELSNRFSEDRKFGFEERGALTLKVYTYDFSLEYHSSLKGMVERQMRKAIQMTGDFWYTAWVDGGQPDLNTLEISLVFDFEQKTDSVSIGFHESGIISK